MSIYLSNRGHSNNFKNTQLYLWQHCLQRFNCSLIVQVCVLLAVSGSTSRCLLARLFALAQGVRIAATKAGPSFVGFLPFCCRGTGESLAGFLRRSLLWSRNRGFQRNNGSFVEGLEREWKVDGFCCGRRKKGKLGIRWLAINSSMFWCDEQS